MSDFKIFDKQRVMAYFTAEQIQEMNELLPQIIEYEPGDVAGKVIFNIFKVAQSKRVEVPKFKDNPETLQRIADLEKLNTDLATLNQSLVEQLDQERSKPPVQIPLSDKQFIVEVQPLTDHFLTAIARHLGISKQEVLTDLFTQQVVHGPGDHLPLTWSRDQINKLSKQLNS